MAIETSGRIGGVSLAQGHRLLCEQEFTAAQCHAAELLPTMSRLCDRQGWQARDIEQLHVSIGPGSFTGLRIAVTVAKTLAWSQGTRIVPVPSTEALVLNAAPVAGKDQDVQTVAVILDAKRREVFAAVYQRIGEVTSPNAEAAGFASGFRCTLEPTVISPRELLACTGRPLHVLGEGLVQHKRELADDNEVVCLGECYWQPRARNVHQCGCLRAQAGLFCSPQELMPTYLRRPEAVERWEQLHGKEPERQ